MASSDHDEIRLQVGSSVTIHTGNVIDVVKKTSQGATVELVESLKTALRSWLKSEDRSSCDETHKIWEVYNLKKSVKITKEERKDLKLTVKLLLMSFDPDALNVCINKVLNELDVSYIESVIVAFPPVEYKLSLEDIQPVWLRLEEEVKQGTVLTIGISDLDTELLIELFNWSKVKPSVNQVNLSSCCVIPQDMTAFAKEKDIQLLTHNDPRDILPEGEANDVMSNVFTIPSGAYWSPLWIVRYLGLVRGRGVIQTKGFIACFQTKEHVRPPVN